MRNLFKRQKPQMISRAFWDEELDEPCICGEGFCSPITEYMGYGDPYFNSCMRCWAEVGRGLVYLREQIRKRNREIVKERATLALTRRQTRWTVISGVIGALALVIAVVALVAA